MTLDEWISKLDNEEADKLSQMEQLELKDMLIQLLGYKVKFGGITVEEIVKYLDIHQAECEEREDKDTVTYKKGYKKGWNDCIRDRADGWMVDYID